MMKIKNDFDFHISFKEFYANMAESMKKGNSTFEALDVNKDYTLKIEGLHAKN